MLFLLYINDLPNSLLSSPIASLADDTKLIKTINLRQDADLLQNDLYSLCKWSLRSGLNFNKLKTKSQTVTRGKVPVNYPYHLGGKPIEKLEAEQDLGFWMTNDLTWSKQVAVQAITANRMLGLVRWTLQEVTNSCVRRTTYLAIVRPHLGSATQVWSTAICRSDQAFRADSTLYSQSCLEPTISLYDILERTPAVPKLTSNKLPA